MTGAMATLQQRFDAYVTARPTLALAIRASLLTVIVVSAIYAVWDFGFDWARPEGDPWNYLAAGERLNAGHPLYTLSAGDRPVILRPPFWSVPLLAPPPIAVLWRPLALLGDSSMFLWGFAGLIGVLASALYAARRGAYLLLAVVAQSMALVAISGNASALILPMLIGAWIVRDRPWIVGLLIAAATAVKLTPVVLIVWLIATNRWRAVGATLAWALAIGVVSLVGAGLDLWVAWIESVPSSRPSPVALSTLTGLPTVAVAALLCVPILLAWRRDRLGLRRRHHRDRAGHPGPVLHGDRAARGDPDRPRSGGRPLVGRSSASSSPRQIASDSPGRCHAIGRPRPVGVSGACLIGSRTSMASG